MKTYVIGDIHGAGLELEILLDQIAPSSSDRIISVGDILDRGKYAALSYKLLKNHTVFMGNHEYKMAQFLRGERNSLPPHYYVALNNLYDNGIYPEELLNWIDNLPYVHDYGDFIVTHGGVVLDNPAEKSLSMNVFYRDGRNLYHGQVDNDINIPKLPIPDIDGGDFWWDLYEGDKFVIYGHLVCGNDVPRRRKNSIGIDTAAVHGGALTACCPEDDKIIQYKSGIDWGKRVKQEISNGIQLYKEILDFAV